MQQPQSKVVFCKNQPLRKGIPGNEKIWHTYIANGEEVFVITSKLKREYYYLYELVNDEYKKLGKADSPSELEKRFNIYKKLNY